MDRESDAIRLFVNGTLMSGEPLHPNLDGAKLCGEGRTAPCYRLFSVADRHPAMIRVPTGGVAVSGEVYEVPLDVLASVLEGEPEGLGIGVVELAEGRRSLGIVWLEPDVPSNVRDISHFGDWRLYRRSLAA
jgi:gamma-glutamylcyclotransferase (GGCT)/AIG2-like uncharacterized protein YtfP